MNFPSQMRSILLPMCFHVGYRNSCMLHVACPPKFVTKGAQEASTRFGLCSGTNMHMLMCKTTCRPLHAYLRSNKRLQQDRHMPVSKLHALEGPHNRNTVGTPQLVHELRGEAMWGQLAGDVECVRHLCIQT